MPFTFGFRTLKSPLSHEITAGSGTLSLTLPPLPGATAEITSAKVAEMMFETDAHQSRSANPGPVEPAPVSAADFPQ